ncbi:hypothetical protein A3Q05_06485 [Lactobacillus johnsonii]|uniref:Uncharacterized protein n=1 Tax=Lactobacillus johnsonii TaxID=33959 RepID=A0A267MCM9_LACJH|nr:hypothetical protein [Lactobacillus johnsonii]PAB54616.1 hypothetical protein A3Q05_06485 [Lactobacillus johnsonii]PAB57306.1 hypothetical protein A3Q24_00225 [Lactobacillus johnsonii]PEG69549.1 hypothetical protein A3Q04_03570 [Lactobacillus johnsonii]
MNFEKTNKIEKEIANIPVKELEERIENSNNDIDKRFWLTLKNRRLQYRQRKIINQKEFIR